MPAPPPRRIAQALLGTPKGGDLPAGLLGSQGSMSSYTPTMREKMAGLLAKGWFGDTREGNRKAERLVNVGETMVPPLGLLSGSYDAGRALGSGNMMQAGVLGGLAALPLPGAAKKGIKAYHGSPHSFDKFNAGKIESEQAFGRGLYFTEDEPTAKLYASSDGAEGRTYEVDIDADQSHLLDWDKPLSEQPQKVRELAKSLGIPETTTYEKLSNKIGGASTPVTKPLLGSELYQMASPEALKQAGIPGIKYTDGGKRNYVVFDDKLVKIRK